MDLSHIINQLGEEREQYLHAVSPPIFQSSNFAYPNIAQLRLALKDELNTPFYTRGCNPTVAILRKKIAALEQAEDALITGSGSAAIAMAVISQLKANDHVICVAKPYSWTFNLLNNLLPRFGVTTTFIDGETISNYKNALQSNTKLVFLESPNSMTFELQDLSEVASFAKKHQFTTIIGNSYASPIFQNPISFGIDMVVHSASKYIGGHSDVVAGVICGKAQTIRKIFENEFMTLGSIISPNDAWLLLRGLRTLPIRMERVENTTQQVVAFLAQHPLVESINYPFYQQSAQYKLAKQQMRGAGGLLSFTIKADSLAQMETFCNNLQYFLLACSWGGYESLAFPICCLYESENYGRTNLPYNFVRLYIGLEDPEPLIEDLSNALNAVEKMKSKTRI